MYVKKLLKLFKNIHNNNEVIFFYNDIVLLARNKDLYTKGGVPDTLDGRFELIAMHCHFFIRRLLCSGSQNKVFSQHLINYMVTDFDRSLREMGAGDLSVGKKIKFMVSGYYGRASAYDRAIEENYKILDEVLKNNLYGTISPKKTEIKYMKKYIKDLLHFLKVMNDNQVKVCFKNNINFKKTHQNVK